MPLILLLLAVFLWAPAAWAAPTVRAVGVFDASVGAASPGLPTGTLAGDLLLTGCATTCDAPEVLASGYQAVRAASCNGTDARISVLYRIAESCSPITSCNSFVSNVPHNHIICATIGVTVGTFDAADPFNVTAVNNSGGVTTAPSVAGAVTDIENTLVLAWAAGAGSGSVSNWSNGNLTGVTDRINAPTLLGDDSTLAAGTGVFVGDGDYGATTAISTSMRFAFMSMAINPAPPTPTATRTATHSQTPTVTGTATITQTPSVTSTPSATGTVSPTPLPGCAVHGATPVAIADDGYTSSVSTAPTPWPVVPGPFSGDSASLALAGKWNFFSARFLDVGHVRWDTSFLGAMGYSPYAGVFRLPAKVTNAGSRSLHGRYVDAEGPWSSVDHQDFTIGADEAFTVAGSTLAGPAGPRDIPLTNVETGVDPFGYTGIDFTATGGAPSDGDGLLVEWDERRSVAPTPPAGTYGIPEVILWSCPNTPTATATATITPTATATVTATGTPTRRPAAQRCRDFDGDADCGLGLVGNASLIPILNDLIWTLADYDSVCSFLDGDQPSAIGLALQRDTVWAPGADRGKCVWPGQLKRGTSQFIDTMLIDVLWVADYVLTRYAPLTGVCHGGGPFHVSQPLGLFEVLPDGNRRCASGAAYKADCSVTPCPDDQFPSDPRLTKCQFGALIPEDGVETVGCANGVGQERTKVAVAIQVVKRLVNLLREQGITPMLILPPAPPSWTLDRCINALDTAAVPPEGAKVPLPALAAQNEPAVCAALAMAKWMPAYAEEAPKIATINLHEEAKRITNGEPWRVYANQTDLATEGAGHCTCIRDTDCGAGGACDPEQFYCTAGPKNSCTKDTQCRGSDNMARPGHPICREDYGAMLTKPIVACLDGCDRDGYAEAGIIRCDTERYPAAEEYVPCPTYTIPAPPTETATRTITPTPGATNTHTEAPTITPGGPTLTATRTPTQSQTPATPPTFTSGGNPKCNSLQGAPNKLATKWRQTENWGNKIADPDGGGQKWGYAPDSKAVPTFDDSFKAVYKQPGGIQPGVIDYFTVCGDRHDSATSCTYGIMQRLGHLWAYKWLYSCTDRWDPTKYPACASNWNSCFTPACNPDCTIGDGLAYWQWRGSPELPVRGGQCDLTRYFDMEFGPLWELGVCEQEVDIYPMMTDYLAFLQRYGRCASSPTTPCESDEDCGIFGGICNNLLNSPPWKPDGLGTAPDGAVSRKCAGQVMNQISDKAMNDVVSGGCVDKNPGESDVAFWNRCLWFTCYDQWRTFNSGGECGKLAGDTVPFESEAAPQFTMLSVGSGTTIPECYPAGSAGNISNDTAQIDCQTFFRLCRDWNRRMLPTMYASRQQFSPRLPDGVPGIYGDPGPAPFEP